ncbi:MAG: redoxin domain-containing protein [Gemmatimonadaceae bacterium]
MSTYQLLTPGAAAPDFGADASDGKKYRLTEVLERGHAVLVFYPGNNTPG